MTPQVCFHCHKPIQDDVKAYQDGNTFPKTSKYYSGEHNARYYRWVCPDCQRNEEMWFSHLLNQRLERWLRDEEMIERDCSRNKAGKG